MKSQKFIFICVVLLTSLQCCLGQAGASLGGSPLKVDEFGKTGCEDLWARIDYFSNDLANDTDSNGYILIHGNSDLFENLHFESWVKGILKSKNLKTDRLKVIRSRAADRFYVEFWKLPAKPEVTDSIQDFVKEREVKWSYNLSTTTTKPFIFHEYLREDGLCPISSQVKLYVDFLLANPEARGHLVIRDKNTGKMRQAEAKVLDELVNQYKVPRNRLKVFYQKDRSYRYDFTNVEFWYVPKKK